MAEERYAIAVARGKAALLGAIDEFLLQRERAAPHFVTEAAGLLAWLRMRIPFDNTYARLPNAFFETIDPTPVSAPVMIRLNHDLATELGIDIARLDSQEDLSGPTRVKRLVPFGSTRPSASRALVSPAAHGS